MLYSMFSNVSYINNCISVYYKIKKYFRNVSKRKNETENLHI